MRKLTNFFLMTLLASVLAGDSVFAAQPRRQEPPPDDETSNMSIEEIRNYYSYYYAPGGRDPLTMRLPTNVELGMEKAGGSGKIAPTLEQIEKFLNDTLRNLSVSIKNARYDDAVKEGSEAITRIDNEWPPLAPGSLDLLQRVDSIRSYTSLAKNLKDNYNIKTEFESMAIRVEGVIWSPIDAKAVVNGRLLAAGEVMLNERKQGDLRVDIIEERGVVFQFKGMRFHLPVIMYSRPDMVGKTGAVS
jgi:hypothetical protein